MTPTNVTSRLYEQALAQPNARAYSFEGDSPLTFDELWRWVDRIRQNMRVCGFQPGDRVVLLTPVGRDLVPMIIAMFADGVVPVLIDPRMKLRVWWQAIKLSGAKHIVSEPALLNMKWIWWPLFRLSLHRRSEVTSTENTETSGGHELPIPSSESDAVLVTLTSGTTGHPKLILRRFDVLLSQQTLSTAHLPSVSKDVHLTAFAVAALQALVDGAFVILARDQVVDRAIQALNSFKPTRVSGSPAFLTEIIEHTAFNLAESVECVMTGGAPLPKWFLKNLKSAFKSASIYSVYGSTECEPIALTDEASSKKGVGYFVGSVIPELQLKPVPIGKVDDDDVFEIYVQGPNVVAGPSQMLKTGDLARRDKDGHLWLLGRRTEMIGSIPTAYLEEPLEGQGGIKRIAFVQRSEDQANEVHGFAETDGTCDTSQVESLARARVQRYALHLKSFTILTALFVDRRHRWKIQRDALRRLCR